MSFNNVEDAFKTIQREINTLKYQNKRLLAENDRLKNEHYKDEELSKMKSRLETISKDCYRGFPISEKEHENIREWKNRHEEAHNCHSLKDKLKYGGCIGGTYTYEFIPTSIGTVGTVRCSCGAEFIFREL